MLGKNCFTRSIKNCPSNSTSFLPLVLRGSLIIFSPEVRCQQIYQIRVSSSSSNMDRKMESIVVGTHRNVEYLDSCSWHYNQCLLSVEYYVIYRWSGLYDFGVSRFGGSKLVFWVYRIPLAPHLLNQMVYEINSLGSLWYGEFCIC